MTLTLNTERDFTLKRHTWFRCHLPTGSAQRPTDKRHALVIPVPCLKIIALAIYKTKGFYFSVACCTPLTFYPHCTVLNLFKLNFNFKSNPSQTSVFLMFIIMYSYTIHINVEYNYMYAPI